MSFRVEKRSDTERAEAWWREWTVEWSVKAWTARRVVGWWRWVDWWWWVDWTEMREWRGGDERETESGSNREKSKESNRE